MAVIGDELIGSHKNTQLFIHRNAFENVVCEMTAIRYELIGSHKNAQFFIYRNAFENVCEMAAIRDE